MMMMVDVVVAVMVVVVEMVMLVGLILMTEMTNAEATNANPPGVYHVTPHNLTYCRTTNTVTQ